MCNGTIWKDHKIILCPAHRAEYEKFERDFAEWKSQPIREGYIRMREADMSNDQEAARCRNNMFLEIALWKKYRDQPDLSQFECRQRQIDAYDRRIREDPNFAKREKERKEWLRLEAKRKLSRIISEQPKEKWMAAAVELFGSNNWTAQSALLNVRSEFENGDDDTRFKLFDQVYGANMK